ncbi:MAG: DUF177 domain-containing protein [Candidatus Gastranaerophilaceae bacterium]|nr:DUF177 domain-containing protein [Candidatus Gastranaerophilaceae bacterium]
MRHIVTIDEIENSDNKTLNYTFDDMIEGIDSEGTITSKLEIKSLGEFIEVSGNVKGILNLECDLCLNKFKYNLEFDIDEMFAKYALQDEYGKETELKDGQFMTDLNGTNEIDIYDLLYQSVILNLPNRKVCGINCNRDNFFVEEEISDSRMDVFKNIQIQPKSK